MGTPAAPLPALLSGDECQRESHSAPASGGRLHRHHQRRLDRGKREWKLPQPARVGGQANQTNHPYKACRRFHSQVHHGALSKLFGAQRVHFIAAPCWLH